jgi:hypothetical protein
MKRLITVTALFAAAFCAQAKDEKSDRTATTAPAAAAPSIPKDATKNADGTYSYTDKEGKKWVYVNTPFGVMKNPATNDAADRQPQPSAATKVIDKGDSVRFEQPGPFGTISWEKKKSDMTDQERQIVESQKQTAKPDAK